MDYLMILFIILAVGTLNVACFFIGAKVGQKVVKDEPLELPSLNPLEKVRENRARKAAAAEEERVNTIYQNLDAYNGTGEGQKDIPRG